MCPLAKSLVPQRARPGRHSPDSPGPSGALCAKLPVWRHSSCLQRRPSVTATLLGAGLVHKSHVMAGLPGTFISPLSVVVAPKTLLQLTAGPSVWPSAATGASGGGRLMSSGAAGGAGQTSWRRASSSRGRKGRKGNVKLRPC